MHVKVDLVLTPAAKLKEMVAQFRAYPLQLLAEKVETREEFEHCFALGFEMYQGYYFSRPSLIQKRRMDDSLTVLLKLMRQLSEDAELTVIEHTFRESPTLTYKMLLLVNSVGIGMRDKIQTVRHAVAILGRQQIKRWVQLALFTADDDESGVNPLTDMAASRAGLMENLAGHHGALKGSKDCIEKAFMTGVLSLLERVYDIPIEEMIARVQLTEDIVAALTTRSGPLGELLEIAEMAEGKEPERVGPQLEKMGISFEDFLSAQRKAYSWSRDLQAAPAP